jgi:hypothetical protein
MSHPVELAVFDFDGTLFRSPVPPDGNMLWWAQPQSLHDVQHGPGLDGRWVLPVVIAARRASLDPTVLTVVLTARPSFRSMQREIGRVLALTQISFDALQLKPIVLPVTDAVYKGGAISAWLARYPSIRKVTFFDDLPENLQAVEKAAIAGGCSFTGVQGPGM